ncbi:hypothetical protein M8369_39315, partial [Klebsiella pneumoniae]|nr:hypothetical protein [Klebsiella pneumoniae]
MRRLRHFNNITGRADGIIKVEQDAQQDNALQAAGIAADNRFIQFTRYFTGGVYLANGTERA